MIDRPLISHAVVGLLAASLIGGFAGCGPGADPAGPTSHSPLPTDISTIGESTDPVAVGEQVHTAMAALTSYRMEIRSESQIEDRMLISETTVLVDISDPALAKVKSISVNDGNTIEMIQIGSDIYTRLPEANSYQHAANQPTDIPVAGGAEQLFTRAQQVRLIGEERIDGKPVTHFLLLDAGATIDAYIDADNHVVRSVTTTQPAGPSAGGATMGRSTVEINWFDLNQPQEIEAPDPSQISER